MFSPSDLKKRTYRELANTLLTTARRLKTDATEQELLQMIHRFVRPTISTNIREIITSAQDLIEMINILENPLEKKALLIGMGLSKDIDMSDLLWRAMFMTPETFEVILDALQPESNKRLFIECCMSEYTLSHFSLTHPHLKMKIAAFVNTNSTSFASNTAMAAQTKAATDELTGILTHTRHHTASGARGWDGLVVYSYKKEDLEILEPFLIAAKAKDTERMRTILATDRTNTGESLFAIEGGYSNLLIICAESNLVEGVLCIVDELNVRTQIMKNQTTDSDSEPDEDEITVYITKSLKYAKSPEVATLLLNTGVDMRSALNTALIYACHDKKSSVMAEFYLENGASVDSAEKGKTALMEAIQFGCDAIVSMLLRRGADIGAMDKAKQSALTFAIEKPSILRLLIQHGANIHANNCGGSTVLHRTVMVGAFESTALLLSHGANIETIDNLGRTPISIAMENRTKGSEMHREFSKTAALIIEKSRELQQRTTQQASTVAAQPAPAATATPSQLENARPSDLRACSHFPAADKPNDSGGKKETKKPCVIM